MSFLREKEGIYLDILPVVTFIVALVASILSGIAGGGVGFVMAPYWLISGMNLAQGASTNAFMATGMSISSLAIFRKTDHFPKDKGLIYILSVVAVLASILGALIVPKIDMHVYKNILAVITILAVPLLFVKPRATHFFHKHRTVGLFIAIVLLIVGSIITSSSFSILFTLTLIGFFNMSVMQTTALKRLVYIVQSVVLFTGFAIQGYFVWQHALAGFIGGSIGSYIGTKYAVKKGEIFAKYALAIMSLIGALALLL